MNVETIESILKYLDRVTLTGHKERQDMNEIVSELVKYAKQSTAPAEPPEE